MSKSIYEEALEIVERNTFELGKGLDVLGANDRTIIEYALEKAYKQEKLLELYRQLVIDLGLVIERDTTDDWDGPVDYEYLEINDNGLDALKTYKKIKELENND